MQKKRIEEKISQMLLLGFEGMHVSEQDEIVRAIKLSQIGGVILFDYHFQKRCYSHNIESPSQLLSLTQSLQAYASRYTTSPLWIGIDYEGGKVNRLHERYGFPATLSAAELGKATSAQRIHYAAQMAATLADVGINLNFAPVVDVNFNPNNPVIGKLERSFSAQPEEVITCANIFAQAYAARGIIPVYKHFPGQGSAQNDTHLGLAEVTQTWREAELLPYQALLAQKHLPAMVMTAHVIHAGLDPSFYPASLSYPISHQLLRQQLNYSGVIVTDDMQMKAITAHYGQAEAIILAINAGADLLVFGNQLVEQPVAAEELISIIIHALEMKKISLARIEEAYTRLMKLKQHLIVT